MNNIIRCLFFNTECCHTITFFFLWLILNKRVSASDRSHTLSMPLSAPARWCFSSPCFNLLKVIYCVASNKQREGKGDSKYFTISSCLLEVELKWVSEIKRSRTIKGCRGLGDKTMVESLDQTGGTKIIQIKLHWATQITLPWLIDSSLELSHSLHRFFLLFYNKCKYRMHCGVIFIILGLATISESIFLFIQFFSAVSAKHLLMFECGIAINSKKKKQLTI